MTNLAKLQAKLNRRIKKRSKQGKNHWTNSLALDSTPLRESMERKCAYSLIKIKALNSTRRGRFYGQRLKKEPK